MLFDSRRPHVFREELVTPSNATMAAARTQDRATERISRYGACEELAVHLAKDKTRIVTVEAWRDLASLRKDADLAASGTASYVRAATDGVDPTPVNDPNSGVIVIDMFAVWRPLLWPVSVFNIRNGKAFNAHPGCISTTVLRGIGIGAIATYARWRSIADFLDAFALQTGHSVDSTDDINTAAARMTLGLIKPSYHAYDLISFQEQMP